MIKRIIQLFSKKVYINNKALNSNDLNQINANFSNMPKSAEDLKRVGDQHFKIGQFTQAKIQYKQSIALDNNQFEVYKNLGVIEYNQGKFEEAIKLYDHALMLKPDYPEALSNRGLALNDLNQFDEALISLDRAIELKSDIAVIHNNRGIVLKSLMRLSEAVESFDQAITLNSIYAEAYNNRGSVLTQLAKPEEALVDLDRAISLKPDYAEAYCNRGAAINDLNRPEEALINVNRAIELKPNFAMAYNNQGISYTNLKKFDQALESFRCAISINPKLAEAYCNLGGVSLCNMQKNEALEYYCRAIEIKPNFAEAYNNKGAVLSDLNRLDESLVAFNSAIKFAPDNDFFLGSTYDVKMKLCDWSDYEKYLKFLEKIAETGKSVAHPFSVLAVSNSAELQLRAAQSFAKKNFPPNNDLPSISKYSKHEKIRLAYLSADFRNHPVSFLTAELFETHDKSKFELIAFSLVSGPDDEMRKRIEPSFDKFIDVSKLSDREVALLMRDMEIDIAIDLGGFTSLCRASIFALRAAPIQINYIGYPGTMGAAYMDYIVADTTIIPITNQKYYSEKVIYLPSFQVNDTKRVISNRKFSREELGLPSNGFVFCCFNNNNKLNPFVFDCWMRILKQVEGSVLWLLGEAPSLVNNLKNEATIRGVNSSRLIFASRLPTPEYLARYRMADLFLDTLPFNAGTTASDALWAGLPVLTQIGEPFAGRMAASLLNAIALPELITSTKEDYESLAIELAINPDKLSKIRRKLAENRLSTPLFDIDYFTRHIESAYTQIYERSQAGLAPDHIHTI